MPLRSRRRRSSPWGKATGHVVPVGGRRTHSRGRSGLRQWQSPPSYPSWLQSPSPTWPHPDKQPHCPLEGLNLGLRNWTQWWDVSLQKEEKLWKQVQFEAEEELGAKPDLPAELVQFLSKGVHALTKSPKHSLALAGGAWQKILAAASSSQSHLQSWKKDRKGETRPCQVSLLMDHWWIVPIQQHSPSLVEGNKDEWEAQTGNMPCRRSMMNIPPNIMPYGRWQPLGCHLHNRRPLADGMPHMSYKGFAHRTFTPCLWLIECLSHLPRENIGSSQGTAGLHRGVWSLARGPMQSCQGAATVHGPIDDFQWGWCYGGLPVGAGGRGTKTFSHPRRRVCPPGWGS